MWVVWAFALFVSMLFCLQSVSVSFACIMKHVLMVLQSQCVTLEGVDEEHEFARLKQSMEMVGFSPETQRK